MKVHKKSNNNLIDTQKRINIKQINFIISALAQIYLNNDIMHIARQQKSVYINN